MIKASVAAAALSILPPAGAIANPWARAAEEEASVAMMVYNGSYFDRATFGRGESKFVIQLSNYRSQTGSVFASSSSANCDPLTNIQSNSAAAPSQIGLVRELRQLSGLTWHHLAEMIGVSSKTLHNWAAGKPIDEKNLRRAGEIASVLRAIDRGSAEANRVLLLHESVGGRALIDLFKRRQFSEIVEAIGLGKGRSASAVPLPPSTIAAWGTEDFGEQLSKWEDRAETDPDPVSRPTRARPANARRKG